MPRSFHFIPANKPNFFKNVDSMPASAFICDLEDPVPEAKKTEARSFLQDFLVQQNSRDRFYVRINSIQSKEFGADVDMLIKLQHPFIVLPKIKSYEQFTQCLSALRPIKGELRAIVIAEDFEILAELAQILGSPEVYGIAAGLEDLLNSMIHSADELANLVCAFIARLSLESKVHKKICIAPVSQAIREENDLRSYCLEMKSWGCDSMFSIHPNQLKVINSVFGPSKMVIEAASRVVGAYEASDKSSQYFICDGELVSKAALIKAQRLLEELHSEKC
ncbi:MAG: HpcH/HpaI aldolase/citrate lyase family protein [Bdellovibrionota bacterium]